VLSLDGANHKIGLSQRLGVAAVDRDIERPGLLAERRAARNAGDGEAPAS